MKTLLHNFKFSPWPKKITQAFLGFMIIFYCSDFLDFSYAQNLSPLRPFNVFCGFITVAGALCFLKKPAVFLKDPFVLKICFLFTLVACYNVFLEVTDPQTWRYSLVKSILLPFACIAAFYISYIARETFEISRLTVQRFFKVSWAVIVIGFLYDIATFGGLSTIEGRYSSFALNPNMSSYLLMLSCFMAISWEKKSFLDYVIIYTSFMFMLSTFSLGSNATFAAVSLYYFYNLSSKEKHPIRFMLYHAFGFFCVYYLVVDLLNTVAILYHGSGYKDTLFMSLFSGLEAKEVLKDYPIARRRLELYDGFVYYGIFRERIEIFWSSLALFQNNPIWGYGSYYLDLMPYSTHNFLLHTLVAFGLIGFTLLSFTAFLLLKKLYELKQPALWGLALIIAGNLVFHHNYMEFIILWIVQGVALSLYSKVD